jgi:hypothetical protein
MADHAARTMEEASRDSTALLRRQTGHVGRLARGLLVTTVRSVGQVRRPEAACCSFADRVGTCGSHTDQRARAADADVPSHVPVSRRDSVDTCGAARRLTQIPQLYARPKGGGFDAGKRTPRLPACGHGCRGHSWQWWRTKRCTSAGSSRYFRFTKRLCTKLARRILPVVSFDERRLEQTDRRDHQGPLAVARRTDASGLRRMPVCDCAILTLESEEPAGPRDRRTLCLDRSGKCPHRRPMLFIDRARTLGMRSTCCGSRMWLSSHPSLRGSSTSGFDTSGGLDNDWGCRRRSASAPSKTPPGIPVPREAPDRPAHAEAQAELLSIRAFFCQTDRFRLIVLYCPWPQQARADIGSVGADSGVASGSTSRAERNAKWRASMRWRVSAYASRATS